MEVVMGYAQVHLYGGKLQDGETVSVDHSVQQFTVTIRSMTPIGVQSLKDLIQKKREEILLD